RTPRTNTSCSAHRFDHVAALYRFTQEDWQMSHDAKEKIVTAMIELISEQGFEGLSVRGVASRASVSIGAVQHHFPTKVRMLEAAMTAVASRAAQRFGELETIEDPLHDFKRSSTC